MMDAFIKLIKLCRFNQCFQKLLQKKEQNRNGESPANHASNDRGEETTWIQSDTGWQPSDHTSSGSLERRQIPKGGIV